MEYLLVLVLGLFAGTLGGVVGTGSSLVLMPAEIVPPKIRLLPEVMEYE